MKTLCVKCGNVNCPTHEEGNQKLADSVLPDVRCMDWIPKLPENLTAMTRKEAATIRPGDRIGVLFGFQKNAFLKVTVVEVGHPKVYRDAIGQVNLPHGRGAKATT